jgi:hypothetical protein
MIVLLPHLMLVDHGMEQAAGRFSVAFQVAWQRLPLDAQAAISAYLQEHPGTVYLCYQMDLDEREVEPLGRAAWWEDRTALTFLAPFILHATELGGPVGVIVHELAHCYHKGSGTWTANDEQEEMNARNTTKTWGFSEPTIDQTIWKPEIEVWRKRHVVDKGHLTERRQILRL